MVRAGGFEPSKANNEDRDGSSGNDPFHARSKAIGGTDDCFDCTKVVQTMDE